MRQGEGPTYEEPRHHEARCAVLSRPPRHLPHPTPTTPSLAQEARGASPSRGCVPCVGGVESMTQRGHPTERPSAPSAEGGPTRECRCTRAKRGGQPSSDACPSKSVPRWHSYTSPCRCRANPFSAFHCRCQAMHRDHRITRAGPTARKAARASKSGTQSAEKPITKPTLSERPKSGNLSGKLGGGLSVGLTLWQLCGNSVATRLITVA